MRYRPQPGMPIQSRVRSACRRRVPGSAQTSFCRRIGRPHDDGVVGIGCIAARLQPVGQQPVSGRNDAGQVGPVGEHRSVFDDGRRYHATCHRARSRTSASVPSSLRSIQLSVVPPMLCEIRGPSDVSLASTATGNASSNVAGVSGVHAASAIQPTARPVCWSNARKRRMGQLCKEFHAVAEICRACILRRLQRHLSAPLRAKETIWG